MSDSTELSEFSTSITNNTESSETEEIISDFSNDSTGYEGIEQDLDIRLLGKLDCLGKIEKGVDFDIESLLFIRKHNIMKLVWVEIWISRLFNTLRNLFYFGMLFKCLIKFYNAEFGDVFRFLDIIFGVEVGTRILYYFILTPLYARSYYKVDEITERLIQGENAESVQPKEDLGSSIYILTFVLIYTITEIFEAIVLSPVTLIFGYIFLEYNVVWYSICSLRTSWRAFKVSFLKKGQYIPAIKAFFSKKYFCFHFGIGIGYLMTCGRKDTKIDFSGTIGTVVTSRRFRQICRIKKRIDEK